MRPSERVSERSDRESMFSMERPRRAAAGAAAAAASKVTDHTTRLSKIHFFQGTLQLAKLGRLEPMCSHSPDSCYVVLQFPKIHIRDLDITRDWEVAGHEVNKRDLAILGGVTAAAVAQNEVSTYTGKTLWLGKAGACWILL